MPGSWLTMQLHVQRLLRLFRVERFFLTTARVGREAPGVPAPPSRLDPARMRVLLAEPLLIHASGRKMTGD
jgi:hypothetical protein